MAKMMNVVRTSERADVVHAHWAFKGTAYGCSNCGEGAITPMGKYCMECGAKMDMDEAGWPVVKGIAPERVEVVHGEWIARHHWMPVSMTAVENRPMCVCSLCGRVNGANFGHAYCPYCGAKMDGKRRDEDGTVS